MNISKLQQYKNASKILTGMLAVTLSVGMITNFSWKEIVGSIKNFELNTVAYADDEGGGEVSPSLGYTIDTEIEELDNLVKWKYKDKDENCIYVKIEHDKDIKGLEDEEDKERVSFKAGTKDVVAKYELREGDKRFKIVDENENYQWVSIEDVKLNVTRAYKNENGDVIAIAMNTEDGAKITKVTYLDDITNPEEIEEIRGRLENNGTSHPIWRYDVDSGTTGVLVYLDGEEIPCEIQLALDWKAPEVERLYRNAANTKMIIKATDNESGIDKIFIDNNRTVTIQGTSRDVIQVYEQKVEKVELYDAVGHKTVVIAEEDATKPKVVLERVREEDGTISKDKYNLIMRDYQSGLWKIESDNSKVLKDYEKDCGKDKYPQTEEKYHLDLTMDGMTGVKKIYVYDALGNKAEIDLENVTCVILYTHNNADGSKIAISLYEEEEDGEEARTIDKIGILNSAKDVKIIEKMPADTRRVLRYYETPAGTTGIRVYYKGDQDLNPPVDYVLDPYEVEPEVDNNNRVYSMVGINRIEYSDGRKVEFNDSMPTMVRVQLSEGGSAMVYDSLDNCVKVE